MHIVLVDFSVLQPAGEFDRSLVKVVTAGSKGSICGSGNTCRRVLDPVALACPGCKAPRDAVDVVQFSPIFKSISAGLGVDCAVVPQLEGT